jgi:hypothetical protein
MSPAEIIHALDRPDVAGASPIIPLHGKEGFCAFAMKYRAAAMSMKMMLSPMVSMKMWLLSIINIVMNRKTNLT